MAERCAICGKPTGKDLLAYPWGWCSRCWRSWCKEDMRGASTGRIAEWASSRARRSERARQKARRDG